MLSWGDALAEDSYPAVCLADEDEDADLANGWDLDIFPEIELRPELRLYTGRPPDLTVSCRGGRVIHAHRDVLTEVDYFEAMLNGPFRESGAESLEVHEDAEVFFEVLRWIYCRDASVDKDIVREVLRLAEFYSIEDLVDHCARALLALEMVASGASCGRAAIDEPGNCKAESSSCNRGGAAGAAGSGGSDGDEAVVTGAGLADAPLPLPSAARVVPLDLGPVAGEEQRDEHDPSLSRDPPSPSSPASQDASAGRRHKAKDV